MSDIFDLTSVSEIFHGSPQRGLKALHPRVSTHGEALVYATPFLEMACTYLAQWDDLDFAQIHSYGDFHLVERYASAFKDILPQGKGSIYYLSPEKFTSFNYMEAISKDVVVPLREVEVDNSWDFVQQVSRTKNLFLHTYPSRPHFVPADDSDLIQKVIGWLGKHGSEWENAPLYKRFQQRHPRLAEQVYSKLTVG